MLCYSKHQLQELGEFLKKHVESEKAVYTSGTAQQASRFSLAIMVSVALQGLAEALKERPALMLFSQKVLVVYMGRRDPILLTLFSEEEDLPRIAGYSGAAAVTAQWRLSTGHGPVKHCQSESGVEDD